jgi:MYXO-CTERM domain-containing protein
MRPMRPRPAFAAAAFAVCFCASGALLAAEHLIEDFEGAQAPAPWVFSNGPEFPGATGSLTAGPGHAGKGAHLAYDLSAGGSYVSAERVLDTPIPALAVSLWVKNAPGIHVTLRVRDDTGQTLQLRAARPMYAWDAAGWYRLVVPIGASDSHWGGADDGVLHGPVHSIAVLAADPIESGAVGAVDFDEVGWLDDMSFALDPTTLARAPVPAGAASLKERLGANIHFTTDDQALDALHSAGFQWVRMDLFWSAVEQQGAYDFGQYDGLVSALQSRDMRAHFILCYSHPDHSSGDSWAPQTPGEITAFGDYAEAAAKHFAGKPVQFEVWNEANIPQFWLPAVNVDDYAALAKEAVHRVHAGNPSALVSTTGTAGVDIDFLRQCLAQGCADEADAVGVHPYRQGGPESAAEDILLLRGIIQASVASNPVVWDTEWGYSSTWYGDGHAADARHRQAVLATREMLTGWALGFPLAVYYDVRDDGTDPAEKEHNFGLLANDYSDKPAMTGLRTLSSFADGRSLTAFGIATSTTLQVLELEGSSDRVYVIWEAADNAKTAISVPVDAQVVDMFGQSLAPAAGSLIVEEQSGPVYVKIAKPVEPDSGAPDGSESDAAADGKVDVPDAVADSTMAEAGVDGGTTSAGAAPASEDGGCGCRAAGTTGHASTWALVLVLAATVTARRRRGVVGAASVSERAGTRQAPNGSE